MHSLNATTISPHLPKGFPDLPTCRVKAAKYGDCWECLSQWSSYCLHSLSFNSSHFCRHPSAPEIYARLEFNQNQPTWLSRATSRRIRLGSRGVIWHSQQHSFRFEILWMKIYFPASPSLCWEPFLSARSFCGSGWDKGEFMILNSRSTPFYRRSLNFKPSADYFLCY